MVKFTSMRIPLFVFISILFFSCGNVENKPSTSISIKKDSSIVSKKPFLIDSNKTEKLNNEAPNSKSNKLVKSHKINKVEQLRFQDGVNDDKMNGEALVIQMELSSKVIFDNPDTIKNYLKDFYMSRKSKFHKMIADDFEHGISVESIAYPKLNFIVEIFGSSFAEKPYQTLRYSVKRNINGIFIIE
ncbi:MAG: hypothetical protein HXX09_08515 [Bacteroidetes bacterium]|nr:hypothetical protein [Bacteroidota bacterium]